MKSQLQIAHYIEGSNKITIETCLFVVINEYKMSKVFARKKGNKESTYNSLLSGLYLLQTLSYR